MPIAYGVDLAEETESSAVIDDAPAEPDPSEVSSTSHRTAKVSAVICRQIDGTCITTGTETTDAYVGEHCGSGRDTQPRCRGPAGTGGCSKAEDSRTQVCVRRSRSLSRRLNQSASLQVLSPASLGRTYYNPDINVNNTL